MSTKTLYLPIVGMHFRPPAKDVLAVLPLGTELILRPEPTNQYDPNALMILVDMQNFPVDKIPVLQAITSGEFDIPELCAEGPLQLGYVAATGGKPARGGPGNLEALALIQEFGLDNLVATLSSSVEGRPAVKIEVIE